MMSRVKNWLRKLWSRITASTPQQQPEPEPPRQRFDTRKRNIGAPWVQHHRGWLDKRPGYYK